jgi:hypothetical protein
VISANASDNLGVTKVEFYVDGTIVGTDTSAPYSYTWSTTTIPTGAHSLTARAHDAAGNTATSTPQITVTVTTSDTPPTVNITSPTSGTSVQIGTAVNIAASAQDNTSVSKVEFYVDNVLKSTDTSAPYSYSWPTTGVAAGPHTLLAKAYDPGNKVGSSSIVSVTLISGTVTPGTNGDSNGDGKVNGLDYSVLKAHDGQNYPAADYDKDGVVGAGDLAILLSRWTW